MNLKNTQMRLIARIIVYTYIIINTLLQHLISKRREIDTEMHIYL